MCSNVAAFIISLTISTVTSSVDLSFADESQVVYPRVFQERTRSRRHAYSDVYIEETGKLEIIEVGDWAVELNSGTNLVVAPGLAAEWIAANGTRRLEALQPCDYRSGVVRGWETTSTAAVTLCGRQLTGYMDVAGITYFLQPLNETDGAHVMYNSNGFHGRLKRSHSDNNFYAADRSTQEQWLFNLTGDTINIGEGDVEIELDQRSSEEDTSSSNEGELDISAPGGNSSIAETPALSYRREWHREQLDDEELGYFYDTAWKMSQRISYVSGHNHGGSTLPTRWLEIAVAVDHTLITFHGRNKVEQYVLALMNIVSAIYQDPSLEANIKLVITRLLLYENKKQSVVRPGNAKKSLENANSWNKRLHVRLAPGEPRHDVAIWLTRSDFGGPSGYAPLSGACDPNRSCALNKDEGLTSAFIIAHEMGHILGLSHDGDKKSNNDCGQEALDGSVMAPMVAATFNKFSWSKCSKDEFRRSSVKWHCLFNTPSGLEDIKLNATLQTSFSMDEQCRMEFGDGYSMCRAFDIIEPCSHLWCGHVDSPLVCKTKKGPPLEGTECGFGKWCVNGYCEEVEGNRLGRVPVVLNPQDGGWSDWTPWGPCSRTCGIGVTFKSRKCNNPTPSYGGKPCEGKSEEWKTCNVEICPEPYADIRAQQCKVLPNVVNFKVKKQGKYTWLPYESEKDDQKCKLICISEGTNELFTSEENLLDGTPCSYENFKICVQGKCEDVGCDGNINSDLKFDSCGICGGNNSNCSNIKTYYKRKLRREVSRIAALPRLAREIKVETNVTVNHVDNPMVAFIVKNRRKKKYTITIPYSTVFTAIIEGARFHYKKFGNKHNIWTKGPILEEIVIMVYSPLSEIESGLNVSIRSNYFIHKDALIPSKRYVWIPGGWGPCSASCGGGKRQKTTACWDNQNNKMTRRKFCSLLVKPVLETQKCNTFGCNFQWVPGEWEPCSATCGTKGVQQRELYCIPNSVLSAVVHNSSTIDSPWKYMVNPNRCSGISPPSEKPCNRQPCQSFWEFGEWSQCSTSCGRGFSTRTSKCPPPKGESFFTCGEAPPSQKRVCVEFTKDTNSTCRGRRRKHCVRDESRYCALNLLAKYCAMGGFRRVCCKSCLNFRLNPVTI